MIKECICCKNTINLENNISKSSIFCKECSQKLTQKEKQYYYKLNIGYIPFNFNCIKCGSTQTSLRKKYKGVKIKHHFCDKCCLELDTNARRRFLRDFVKNVLKS